MTADHRVTRGPGTTADPLTGWDHLVTSTRRTLQGWGPASDHEAELRERFGAMVETWAADALAKGRRPEHITASLLVLDRDARRVLLTHHTKADCWLQFGGHLEQADGSIEAAARREGTEESGLVIDGPLLPLRLDAHLLGGGFSCAEHLDIAWLTVVDEQAPVVSDESNDVRWFDVDRLPDPIGALVPEMVGRARAILR